MRTAYDMVLRNLTFRAIKLETRMSDRQIAGLRWQNIHDNVIDTDRHRSCEISRELVEALALLPRKKSGVDLVFFGDSLSEWEQFKADQDKPKHSALKGIFAVRGR